MSKIAERGVGVDLMLGIFFVWNFYVFITQRVRKSKPMIGVPIAAAVIAYTCYMAAALLGGAEFPEFLREHLFDGLAPGAAIGLIINYFPAENPEEALLWIRRPVIVIVAYGVGGALMFGLIAAAAVFTSGSDDFALPIWYCAFIGANMFSSAYFVAADRLGTVWEPKNLKWYFEKRPNRAAMPGRGDLEAATSDVADQAEDRTAPGPASDDL
jgi:hypothetical protein